VASSLSGTGTGVLTEVTIANCDNLATDNSVGFGSTIKAIFISSSVFTSIGSDASTMAIQLVKLDGNTTSALSNPNGTLNPFTQNMSIFWFRMTPRTQNFAHNFIGWLKLPRRRQIFNEGDTLIWRMSVIIPSGDWSHCSNFVYKWRG